MNIKNCDIIAYHTINNNKKYFFRKNKEQTKRSHKHYAVLCYGEKELPSKSMHHIANRMKQIIIQEKRIHKYDLINLLGISVSYYEKIKPWFEHTFSAYAKYDRETKEWKCMLDEKS